MTEPLELLMRARENGESFVLLSRHVVFDCGVSAEVMEDTPAFPGCDAGKMLQVAEKAVLRYDKGYIVRTGELLDDTERLLDSFDEMPRRFRNEILQPVCPECVDFLVAAIPRIIPAGTSGRIVHATPYCSFELAAVLMQRFGYERHFQVGEEFPEIVPHCNLVFSGYRIAEILNPAELSAYVRTNEENCKWRLYRG